MNCRLIKQYDCPWIFQVPGCKSKEDFKSIRLIYHLTHEQVVKSKMIYSRVGEEYYLYKHPQGLQTGLCSRKTFEMLVCFVEMAWSRTTEKLEKIAEG